MSHPDLRDQLPAAVPIWREPLAMLEWQALRWSPSYWGIALPRGRREAVVAVPGFLGSDLYLAELRSWLRRIGYRPYRSGISRNADCLDELSKGLLEVAERAAQDTGGRVHLVGHSLGGVLSRGVATLRPDLIASVITLGSPIRGLRSHRSAMRTAERVRLRILSERPRNPECYSGYCDCPFVTAARSPFPEEVPQLAIFTRTDGVVDWRYSRHPTPELNSEVRGTHCGLAFNAQAYRRIAGFLRRTARRVPRTDTTQAHDSESTSPERQPGAAA